MQAEIKQFTQSVVAVVELFKFLEKSVDPLPKVVASSSSKPRGQTMAETLEEHDKNLHKMPASYRRMVRMAREAEAEGDSNSLIKHSGFKPVCPEDKPSETDPKTKQDQEA